MNVPVTLALAALAGSSTVGRSTRARTGARLLLKSTTMMTAAIDRTAMPDITKAKAEPSMCTITASRPAAAHGLSAAPDRPSPGQRRQAC
ncbi:hypothetical protein [Thiobacillus sp.]|uniref:hypothetical protein n=1 Tax=Thiobacillus sp. TaxID=924 RepID=UPI0025DF04C1|nr:hypothetical protein [Thiobacillus sp.]